MLHTIWQNVIQEPFYNTLVFIVSHIPFHDVGLAVIALTILVKLILFPLNQKAIKSQIKLKSLEPEIRKIKENYPDKQEQSKKTFELYKKYGANPFSGCLVALIQIPILFGLYDIFLKGFYLNENLLYSFINFPTNDPSIIFLGLINITEPSWIFAILAGVSQYFQISISQKNQTLNNPEDKTPASKDKKTDFQTELTKSMATQMKYFLPVFIAFVSWKISAAVTLYWITSNIVGIIQEVLIARKMKKTGIKPELVTK